MEAPDCNQIITTAKPLQWQPMVEEASRSKNEHDKFPIIQQHLKINKVSPGSIQSKKVKHSRLNARSALLRKQKDSLLMMSGLTSRRSLMNLFCKRLLLLRQMLLHVGPWWLALQRKLSFSASFIENPIGLAGGLAIFWNDRVSLMVTSHSSAILDFICTDRDYGITMRLTLAVHRRF